ncbi:N-acetyltransferase [Halobacteriales archaeon QS_8_69_26]|nr:MAG: N-acetyltransferase [Halobacteriales archaeon QS_8_69_26]
MEIRPATADDAEGIGAVAEASWEADYPEVVSRESAAEAAGEWYGPDRMRRAAEDPGTVLLVAAEGEVVGFAHAAVSTERMAGSILRLYVHPDHRRRGIGSDLLAATVEALRDLEVERIEAMVLAANDQGNEFYREAGFRRDDVGETKITGEYYEENVYVYEGE